MLHSIKVLHGLFIRHNELDSSRASIWLIHGFADSGLAYLEVFESPLCKDFNVYVVDMPGFGVSPIQPAYPTIRDHADLLEKIILEETLAEQKVNIVAHSLGALIGTWLCQKLGDRINYYFNLEGNLTEADSYFSSKPLAYKTAGDFFTEFEKEVFEKAKSEERYRRYYSSLRFANPEGMRNWSTSSQEYVKANRCGEEFKALSCPKIYIWGDQDTPLETQNYLEKEQIPNKLYQGVGHWHMLENATVLYQDIFDLLEV